MKDKAVVVDPEDGKATRITSEEVNSVFVDAVVNGQVIAIIVRSPAGAYAVRIAVPVASAEAAALPEVLESIAASLRSSRLKLSE